MLTRQLLAWREKVIKHETAIFRQINKERVAAHHDALEFPDGQILLLTNVRQLVKVNVSNKWHRPIAMRTLYIGRTLLCFGGFHLGQCSALPALGCLKTDVSASSPRWASSIIIFATSRVPASSTNFRLKDLAYTFEASRHFGYCFGVKCQTREKRTNRHYRCFSRSLTEHQTSYR